MPDNVTMKMVIVVGFPGGICNTTAKIQLACNYGAGSESLQHEP